MKINQHTSHPSAFISSTFVDLEDERDCVAKGLQECGLIVNALEVKPASNGTSRSEIVKGIRESDFVILIIADRFGSIVPKITNSQSLSVTWWEYKMAITFGKPVIAFFQKSDFFNTNYHDSTSDESYPRKRKLFEKFKSLITVSHNPAYFTDSYDLSEKVKRSLISTYREGVVKLDSDKSSLNRTIANKEALISCLEAENKELKRKLDKTQNPSGIGMLTGFGSLSK